MPRILIKLYADTTLPAGAVLAKVPDTDLGAQGEISLVLWVGDNSVGEKYIAPGGRDRSPHYWSVQSVKKEGEWYLALPAELVRQTEAVPHLGELYAGGNVTSPFLQDAAFFFKEDYPVWEPTNAGSGDPLPPPPPPPPPPLPPPPPPPPPVRPRPGKIGMVVMLALSLAVLAGGGLWYLKWPPFDRVGPGLKRPAALNWRIGQSVEVFDIAKALGQSTNSCKDAHLAAQPVFGDAAFGGAVLKYKRRAGVLRPSSADNDVLGYRLTCDGKVLSGQIRISFAARAAIKLPEKKIRATRNKPIVLAVSSLPIPQEVAGAAWRWVRLPEGDGISAVLPSTGGAAIIVLTAEGEQRAPFEIRSADGTIAKGVLIVSPSIP